MSVLRPGPKTESICMFSANSAARKKLSFFYHVYGSDPTYRGNIFKEKNEKNHPFSTYWEELRQGPQVALYKIHYFLIWVSQYPSLENSGDFSHGRKNWGYLEIVKIWNFE